MKKNILITGKPKSGKSMLLRKIVAGVPHKTGFMTNEILGEHGRVGFEIETNEGKKAPLAHVDFHTPLKVSKYSVDVSPMESLIPDVLKFGVDDLLYLDEIGQMQLFSSTFEGLVRAFLDSENTCLATLSAVYESPFLDEIRNRNDIILIELSAANREENELFITQLLKKIEKARNYIKEPERFTKEDGRVILRSKHDTRTLVYKDGKWNCTCDFFAKYGICSHAIAIEAL